MTKRLDVITRSEYASIHDLFEGNSIDYVKMLLGLMKENIKTGETAKFRIDHYGYDGGIELYLDFYRPETDAEYEARVEKLEKAAEKARLKREDNKEKARKALMKNEADERAEYERLKEKFGD